PSSSASNDYDKSMLISVASQLEASTTNGLPYSPGKKLTVAPWASTASIYLAIDSIASCGSTPGPSRIENRARAVWTIELEDSAIGVASIPIILSAGLLHKRSAKLTVPASSRSLTAPLWFRYAT